MSNFSRRHVFVLVWLALFLTASYSVQHSGHTLLEWLGIAVEYLKTHPSGPLWLILAYCLRPLVLFPASILAAASGHCFGPGLGLFYAMFASLVAALVGYGVGRWAFHGPSQGEGGKLARYRDHLRENGMQTTMWMRWLMLPYDPVSILCGSVGIHMGAFMLGNIIGNLPGTTSCVLFGASIQTFNGQLPSIDWRLQGPALAVMVTTVLLSQWARRRKAV